MTSVTRLRQEGAQGALRLLDDASALSTRLGARLLAVYAVGTAPFLLLFAYFLADLSTSAFARSRLPYWALVLCVSYGLMKTCQGVFCRELLLALRGDAPSPKLGFARALPQSMAWQPFGLILALISTVLILPLGWVLAFNYHAGVLLPERERLPALLRRVLRESLLWPRQSHWLLLLGAAAFVIVALNAAVLLLVSPALLRSLFGLETRLSAGGFNPLNTTLLAIAACIAYLTVDPLLRAAYTLRSFQASSRFDGRDLGVRVRRFRGFAALAACVSFGTPVAARAAAEQPDATALDRSLDGVLAEPEFAWRAAHAADGTAAEDSLERLFALLNEAERFVGGWLSRFLEWLRPSAGPDESTSVPGWSASLIWLLLSLALLVAGLLLLRVLRSNDARREFSAEVAEPALPEAPLASTPVSPAALPASDWQVLGQRLLEEGQRRLGLRALFLGTLALLHERGFLTAAKHKSIANYALELATHAESSADIQAAFVTTASLFERAWYGSVTVDDAYLAEFRERHERLVSVVLG